MSSFGELLSELRKDRKLSQRKLAAILHVSVGTISNYENDVHFPDVEKLVDLADYFGVTTDYLLGRCESAASPDVFSEKIGPDKTVGGLIKDLNCLSDDRKQALLLVLQDMNFV